MDSDQISNELNINFVTKDKKYSVPSLPINVKSFTTVEELDKIVKTLIKENNDEINLNNIEFDFLIHGKLLRGNIKQFIESENIDQELQIEVEYFAKCQPPKPHKSFLHDDWISSVDTIDEWIVSGCYDSTAHIWNIKNGQHKITIPAHTSSIKAIKWIRKKHQEKDKYSFITCSHDETAMLWNWDSQQNQIEHVHTYIGHCRSVDCVDSKNDLIATGSYDRFLKIWSVTDEEINIENDSNKKNSRLRSPIFTFKGHNEAISGCAWLTDLEVPTVATVSLDHTIKIWDVEVGEAKHTVLSNKSFLGISYNSFNNLFVTASCDQHIRLWDLRQNHGSLVRQIYSSHELWVSSVTWSETNANLFVSGSYDTNVKQWDIRAPSAPLYDMLGHQDKIMSVNWSNEQFIVSGGADCQIKIFST